MRFNENARLDPSQVSDRRGGGMSGRGVAIGGGGIGLVMLIVSMLLGVNPADMAGYGGALSGGGASPAGYASGRAAESGSLIEECRVGADANAREDCQVVGFVN